MILSIGVISARKGHLQTIEAFAHLLRVMPNATLVIAGARHEAEYLLRMEECIKVLGLTAHVTLAIDQPRTAILKLLAQARLFALHSREESQGIVLCEALACGLPIVATRVGGIPYVVDEGKTGLLFAYDDVEGFAGGMERLLNDEALHERFSKHAYSAGMRFDWDNIATKVMELYDRAASGK